LSCDSDQSGWQLLPELRAAGEAVRGWLGALVTTTGWPDRHDRVVVQRTSASLSRTAKAANMVFIMAKGGEEKMWTALDHLKPTTGGDSNSNCQPQ